MNNNNEIPVYRMNLLMKTASDVTNVMTHSKHLYNPTYEELTVILDIVREAIYKSSQGNI